jgi:hypothetical protein
MARFLYFPSGLALIMSHRKLLPGIEIFALICVNASIIRLRLSRAFADGCIATGRYGCISEIGIEHGAAPADELTKLALQCASGSLFFFRSSAMSTSLHQMAVM